MLALDFTLLQHGTGKSERGNVKKGRAGPERGPVRARCARPCVAPASVHSGHFGLRSLFEALQSRYVRFLHVGVALVAPRSYGRNSFSSRLFPVGVWRLQLPTNSLMMNVNLRQEA